MVDAIDVAVGNRIKMRRQTLGMSQREVGSKAGVSFQQMQKYERGINRVSSSRMQLIATALATPVDFFFDEKNEAGSEISSNFSEDTLELAEAFVSISDPRLRRTIVAMIVGLSAQASDADVTQDQQDDKKDAREGGQ